MVCPVQLLLARTSERQRSREPLAALPSACLRETLRAGDEFWTGEKTLRFLSETDYFRPEEEGGQADLQWPPTLLHMCEGTQGG